MAEFDWDAFMAPAAGGAVEPEVKDSSKGASVATRLAASTTPGNVDKGAILRKKLGPDNVWQGEKNGTVFYKVKEGGQWKMLDPDSTTESVLKMLAVGAAPLLAGPAGLAAPGLALMTGDTPGDIADEALPIAKEIGKDEAAMTAAGALGGPAMTLAGPMVQRPVAKQIRAVADGKRSVGDLSSAAKEGAIQGAIDTASGSVLPAAVAARRPVARLAARLSKNNLVGGLTKALHEVVGRGGSIETQRKLAGEAMDAALTAAGNERLAMRNYMTLGSNLRRSAGTKGAGGLLPEEKFVVDGVDEIARDGGEMTLEEADRVIKLFGQRAADAAATGNGALAARWNKARGAMIDDLEESAGRGLAAAADLQTARKAYGKALNRSDQADFLLRAEDPYSVARNVDPAKLAQIASGEGREDVARMFKGDAEGLKRFESLADAARVYASRNKSPGGVAEQVPVLAAAERKLRNLLTASAMYKVAKDPAASALLRKAIDPRFSADPEVTGALVDQVARRIGMSRPSPGALVRASVEPDDETQKPLAGIARQQETAP